MLNRERFEKEYKPLFERQGMGTTVWSPLAQGFLTGKYNDGNFPEGTRFAKFKAEGGMSNMFLNWIMGDKVREKNLAISRKIAEIAKEMGVSQAALSLAWVIACQDTSTALLGFTRLEQIDDNLGAIKLCENWTPELEVKLHQAIDNTPAMEMDWRKWKPELPRRLKGTSLDI